MKVLEKCFFKFFTSLSVVVQPNYNYKFYIITYRQKKKVFIVSSARYARDSLIF